MEHHAQRPRRRITRGRLVGIGLVVGFVALIAWWRWPSAIPVDVTRAVRGTLQVTVDEDAKIHILRHTTVAAPFSGRVLESVFRVGDSVSRGEIVATMEAAPLDPRINAQDAARLRAATAVVEESRAQVVAAELALDEARRARQRADALIAQGAIAPRDHELAVTGEETRQQELNGAQYRLRAAQSDAIAARAALLDARVEPSRATTRAVPVRAPIAGRILRMYEEHDRAVVAGTPLLDLGDLSSIEIVADVLSSDVGDIQPGAIMLVHVTDTATAVRARVTAVEPVAFTKLSPLGVEEQRVNVRAVPIDRFPLLGDAYQVEVSIVRWEGTRVLMIPTSALVASDSGWSIYRLRGNAVQRRSVTIGHRGAHAVEILSGIAEGDRIVLYPSDLLADGTRVCVGSSCR